MSLHVVPVELAEANAFIATHHRHHQPVIGHRFSIGVASVPRNSEQPDLFGESA